MILSATSDDWLNALCTQGVASRLAVVSAIREEDIRMAALPASFAWHSGEIGDSREYLPVITGIRRRGVDDKRHAVSVDDESVLRAQFPAVNRAWTSGVTATESADHDAFDDGQLGFKDACPPEQRQEVHVEIVPHPGFVPSPKSSVSGTARAPKFTWHVFPLAACHQHVPEDLDHGTVRNAWSTALSAYRLLRGKQALQLREERSGIRAPAILAPSMEHEDHEEGVPQSRAERYSSEIARKQLNIPIARIHQAPTSRRLHQPERLLHFWRDKV